MMVWIKRLLRKVRNFFIGGIMHRNEINSMLLAKLHIERIGQLKQIASFRDVEFRVFSQWGEDGIIQYLISNIPIENKIFVEFGVGYYVESNTRFLLKNDRWKGLIIDGDEQYIEYIRNDPIYWMHDLTAVCRFITRENINDIISNAGIEGDIGLLSIDIDGNDFWVWEAIHVISPRVIICEYNSVFGADYAITIPYDANFQRTKAHYSNLYYGTSLSALCVLAEKKGYDFVGSNNIGVNAFFVRKDLSHHVKPITLKEGYIQSQIRESRDIHGNLTLVSGTERLNLIKDLQVVDVKTNTVHVLKDIMDA